MPELPEVETVCRGLAKTIKGHRIKRTTVRRRDLRRPVPDHFAARTEGRMIRDIGRRSKYILIHLDDEGVVIWHLGMSGRVRFYKGNMAGFNPEKHDHIIFESIKEENHDEPPILTIFNDTRRFGLMVLTTENRLADHPLLNHLGPEPLSQSFDTDYFYRRIKKSKAPIKNLILDQGIVPGMGNIYASESLYQAGIDPRQPGTEIVRESAEKLVEAIKDILQRAVEAGGSSIKDHIQTDGTLARFQHQFKVYGRKEEPCQNCDTPIEKIVQGGRATFFCPNCQK